MKDFSLSLSWGSSFMFIIYGTFQFIDFSLFIRPINSVSLVWGVVVDSGINKLDTDLTIGALADVAVNSPSQ